MGLAIVRRLSALMGLRLGVESAFGKGTVFKIWLPATAAHLRPEAAPALRQSLADHALEGLQVLVIDDEEGVRNSTAVALRMHGMVVDVADGLAQARELALEKRNLGQRFDVIISDFRLRGTESGTDVVSEIRQLVGEQTPALLITGETSPERVRQAQQSGLRVQYKPMKMTALLEEVSALVAHQ